LLIGVLTDLVAILEKDPTCRWTSHFQYALDDARQLHSRGATPDELKRLSGFLLQVYGGAGSFGDYGPGIPDPQTGILNPIPGAERFDALSSRLMVLAVDLRAGKRS